MTTANEVFTASMALMDELDENGEPTGEYSEEYLRRVPAILETLLAEKKIFSGEKGMIFPVEDMDDVLIGVDDRYALSILPYGLAANLLVDENPAMAEFFQERYEELRDRFFEFSQADMGTIEEIYGGIEYGCFGRW